MDRKSALRSIFSKQNKSKNPLMRKWKYRFQKSQLSIDKQVEILKAHGFKLVREEEWKRIKNK